MGAAGAGAWTRTHSITHPICAFQSRPVVPTAFCEAGACKALGLYLAPQLCMYEANRERVVGLSRGRMKWGPEGHRAVAHITLWTFIDTPPESGSFRERDSPGGAETGRPRALNLLLLPQQLLPPSEGKGVLCLGVALGQGRHVVKAALSLSGVSAEVSTGQDMGSSRMSCAYCQPPTAAPGRP